MEGALSPVSSLKELPRAERRKLKKKAKRRQIKISEHANANDDDEDLLELEDEFRRKQDEAEREKVNQLWLAKEQEVIVRFFFSYNFGD